LIDLNALQLDGPNGLLATLAQLPDARKRRGIRHRQASVLAIAAAAVLTGARSYTAIGEYAAELGQDVLARLQARRHPVTGRYVAPDESTLRRAIQRVDPDVLDAAIGGWLADQAAAGYVNEQALAVAVDGKSLRGAVTDDGRPVHLFAAMIHNQGVVVAQREVDHKTNEITAFKPLLENLDLQGAVVTADALHTQRDHAAFLVEQKKADYVFTVKGNQPGTLAAVEGLFEQGSFPPQATQPARLIAGTDEWSAGPSRSSIPQRSRSGSRMQPRRGASCVRCSTSTGQPVLARPSTG
jgi:hypothetical protein